MAKSKKEKSKGETNLAFEPSEEVLEEGSVPEEKIKRKSSKKKKSKEENLENESGGVKRKSKKKSSKSKSNNENIELATIENKIEVLDESEPKKKSKKKGNLL